MRLDEIRRALDTHAPLELADAETRRAAVAMVLADRAEGPSVLFIERASREGDPWSGHMAFPGGRVDPEDGNPKQAAERETLEEVGLELRGAEWIGRLDDRQGNPRLKHALLISAFVYVIPEAAPLTLNHEVREAFWFPLGALHEPQRHIAYRAHALDFPGILVGEPQRHVVWGMTYSFLESFFCTVGRPLPHRQSPGHRPMVRDLEEQSA
jgi:8-oxo-dGTP pyrophosphatase MutT (NUDIX family)